MACSRLVTMIYLKIQNGKEEMKSSCFQQQAIGTAAYMNIMVKSTKGCGQLSSKVTFFADIWLIGVL